MKKLALLLFATLCSFQSVAGLIVDSTETAEGVDISFSVDLDAPTNSMPDVTIWFDYNFFNVTDASASWDPLYEDKFITEFVEADEFFGGSVSAIPFDFFDLAFPIATSSFDIVTLSFSGATIANLGFSVLSDGVYINNFEDVYLDTIQGVSVSEPSAFALLGLSLLFLTRSRKKSFA